MILFALLIPSVAAEMAHTPQEVSEGTTFTAWIDVDEDVDVEMIDNKNRKDYGESFMDWSPKLDDYLT